VRCFRPDWGRGGSERTGSTKEERAKQWDAFRNRAHARTSSKILKMVWPFSSSSNDSSSSSSSSAPAKAPANELSFDFSKEQEKPDRFQQQDLQQQQEQQQQDAPSSSTPQQQQQQQGISQEKPYPAPSSLLPWNRSSPSPEEVSNKSLDEQVQECMLGVYRFTVASLFLSLPIGVKKKNMMPVVAAGAVGSVLDFGYDYSLSLSLSLFLSHE
jgi:hypothetical protein